MSSTRQWESAFGRMAWTGPGFGVGVYTDGTMGTLRGAGPTDQLQYLLEGWLREDSTVIAALGGADAVERVGLKPGVDYRRRPRLYIYSGTVDQESITGLDTKRINVFLETLFNVTSIAAPTHGGVTLATWLDYLEWFVKQRDEMVVTLSGGQVNIATLAVVQPYNSLEIFDKKDELSGYSQTLHVQYTVECDRATGRPYNLAHPPS